MSLPDSFALSRRRIIASVQDKLSPPPADLLDEATLFLDLDGTLLDLVDDPESVRADEYLLELLQKLSQKLHGRLAIISGRSIEQIDRIIGPMAAELALSGSHGCEHRWHGISARPNRPHELDLAAERMKLFVEAYPQVLIEEKSFGVGLHYRLMPQAEGAAHALTEALATEFGLMVQHGKMMVELRIAGGNKGSAITRLMDRPMMQGTTPVFAGDDLTDEPGFGAVRALGGYGILIGPQRSTAAQYGLPSPDALKAWLQEAVA